MSGDVLSDLLRAVRLRGALFYYIEGRDPWVTGAPHSSQLIPAIMPRAEHLIEFHGVAKGTCWATIEGLPPVPLRPGDVILFPQGDAHTIASTPGLKPEKMDLGVYFAPPPPQLPFSLQADESGAMTAWLDGGGPAECQVVCGFLGCDARPFNPLLASLPRILHLPGLASEETSSWFGQFMRTAVEESNHRRPGGEAVLERVSEMMFVEALRRYVRSLPPDQKGWLAGMRDPAVGRALALLHARPAEAWTSEQLGVEAGMSRSVLHERFVDLIGQPPMQYLARWRMQLAVAKLRDTEAKLIEIALDVGYESEAAFSRAFKRELGESPGAMRKKLRVPAGR